MEKHIRDFRNFQTKRRTGTDENINESVIQLGDKYRINGIDVPQTVVNAMAKKVKEETGKKLSNMYSDAQIAEEIIKFITTEFLNVESIPTSIFVGGEENQEEEETEPATAIESVPEEPVAEPVVAEEPVVDAPKEETEPATAEFTEPKEEVELPS